MRGPNHYDELKRANDQAEPDLRHVDNQTPPPEREPENRPTPEDEYEPTPSPQSEDVEERIAARDSIYDVRRTLNDRLVAMNAADQTNERLQNPQERFETLREDNARQTAELNFRSTEEQRLVRSAETAQLADENAKKLAEQSNTLNEVRTRFEATGEKPIDRIEQGISHRAGGVDVSNDRYHQALREQNDTRDPYASLGRAALSENSAFHRDQEALEQKIQAETNLDARHSLEQQKDIQAADHIATTSHRIADQSEIIEGSTGTEDALTFRQRAQDFEAQRDAIQENYRERTGRSDWADEPEDTLDRKVRLQSERASSDEHGLAESKQGHLSDWAPAGVEITDAKAERLAALSDHAPSGGMQGPSSSPTRPAGGGDRGSR